MFRPERFHCGGQGACFALALVLAATGALATGERRSDGKEPPAPAAESCPVPKPVMPMPAMPTMPAMPGAGREAGMPSAATKSHSVRHERYGMGYEARLQAEPHQDRGR